MSNDPFGAGIQSAPKSNNSIASGPVRVQSVFAATESQGIKVTVYGRSGVGKTMLLATAPGICFISAENGLLSLRKKILEIRQQTGNANFDFPMIGVKTLADLRNVKNWIKSSSEARQFQTFGLDSISEIAEQVLAEALRTNTHGQKAYGEMAQETVKEFREFRDIDGPNIVFLAKEETVKHGVTGAIRYQPMFPGNATGPQTPYFFDEVFHMFISPPDPEGKTHRLLRTQPTDEAEAKDRSGMLDPIEWPDLGHIFRKINGQT